MTAQAGAAAFGLDVDRMRVALDRNVATSFGLTLVVGLPFPQPLLAGVAQVRDHIDLMAPGGFRWYALDHLHATVLAPLRGRYREGPSLQRSELPQDLEGFVATLNACFGALQPFVLDLDKLVLTPAGLVLAVGPDPGQVRQRVAQNLASWPRLDRPKDLGSWQVTLGFLQTPEPTSSGAHLASLEAGWAEFQSNSVGAMTVDQVWLVHYADRMLSRIVGKAPLPLGRPGSLTADRLLGLLAIGPN